MNVMRIAVVAGTILVAGGAVVVGELRSVGGSGAPPDNDKAMVTAVAAAEQSVTLRVDGMSCPSCPYIASGGHWRTRRASLRRPFRFAIGRRSSPTTVARRRWRH